MATDVQNDDRKDCFQAPCGGRAAFDMPEGCPTVERPDIVDVVACDMPPLTTPAVLIRPAVVEPPDIPFDVDTYCFVVKGDVRGPVEGEKGEFKWWTERDCTEGEYRMRIDVPCGIDLPKKPSKDRRGLSRTCDPESRSESNGWLSASLYRDGDKCEPKLSFDASIPCDLESVSVRPGSGRVSVSEKRSKCGDCSYEAVIDVPCQLPGVSVSATGEATVSEKRSGNSGKECGYSAVIDVPCQLDGVKAKVSYSNERDSYDMLCERTSENFVEYVEIPPGSGNVVIRLAGAASGFLYDLNRADTMTAKLQVLDKMLDDARHEQEKMDAGKPHNPEKIDLAGLMETVVDLSDPSLSARKDQVQALMQADTTALAYTAACADNPEECVKTFDMELECPVESFKMDVSVDTDAKAPSVTPLENRRDKCVLDNRTIRLPKNIGCAFSLFDGDTFTAPVNNNELAAPSVKVSDPGDNCLVSLDLTMPDSCSVEASPVAYDSAAAAAGRAAANEVFVLEKECRSGKRRSWTLLSHDECDIAWSHRGRRATLTKTCYGKEKSSLSVLTDDVETDTDCKDFVHYRVDLSGKKVVQSKWITKRRLMYDALGRLAILGCSPTGDPETDPRDNETVIEFSDECVGFAYYKLEIKNNKLVQAEWTRKMKLAVDTVNGVKTLRLVRCQGVPDEKVDGTETTLFELTSCESSS